MLWESTLKSKKFNRMSRNHFRSPFACVTVPQWLCPGRDFQDYQQSPGKTVKEGAFFEPRPGKPNQKFAGCFAKMGYFSKVRGGFPRKKKEFAEIGDLHQMGVLWLLLVFVSTEKNSTSEEYPIFANRLRNRRVFLASFAWVGVIFKVSRGYRGEREREKIMREGGREGGIDRDSLLFGAFPFFPKDFWGPRGDFLGT